MVNSKLTDIFNIASSFSVRKSWNAGKVFISYHLSNLIGRPIHWGMPISVSIEPTTSCNLRCPECPSGKREFSRNTGMLESEFFHKIIDELSPHISYLTFYFQGEPYLNTGFTDMVSYASAKNIYTATSTNGHYLTPENARKTVQCGLKRLIISIDGTTQETYSAYRIGGQLDKVLEGAKNLVEWKRKLHSTTPYLIFQFLVNRANQSQIQDIIKLGKEIGVDEVKLKTLQVYDYSEGNDLLPSDEQYSRYKKDGSGKYVIKNKLLNHCWRSWQGCVFTWDGQVVPCCFDKDAKHTLGNVNGASFASIWHGDEYRSFRRAILHSRKNIDICKNCTEGATAWL